MKTLKLTPQAVGAIMMAVQKGTMAMMLNKSKEECDITQLLLDFELLNTEDGLVVDNPPTIDFEGMDFDADV